MNGTRTLKRITSPALIVPLAGKLRSSLAGITPIIFDKKIYIGELIEGLNEMMGMICHMVDGRIVKINE